MSIEDKRMKTFMDDEFYMNPMVNQKQLAKHWTMSQSKVNELTQSGAIKLNKAGLISMKQIMDIEELGLQETNEINMRKLVRENEKLAKENARLTTIIDSIKMELQVV